VRASLRLSRLVFVVSAASGCGAAGAQSGRAAAGGPRPDEAARAGSDAADAALSIDTRPQVDSVAVRLTVPERRRRQKLDARIDELARVAQASGFADLAVLTDLSGRQIERGSLGGEMANRDLADANSNLARVLAIDEHSAAALNDLALLHLTEARQKGRPELELAMGVCIRAMREHPLFAPLRNTAGLVAFELRDALGAALHFEAAVRLDAGFSAAQNNLGASLLFGRKFEAAERAYDRALDLRGDDYEAHLGRALARRGQISPANFRAQVASVESDLERCKALDPERPEAYYSDAILTERFKALDAPTDKANLVLERARSLFDTFIAKAGERPEYAKEIHLAKMRVRDLGSKGF